MSEHASGQPRKQAAALRYDPKKAAPEVVAAGFGVVAERLIEVAEAHGVPIRHEPDLASALVSLGVGAEIPPELYAAVAELLAWVASVDEDRGRRLVTR